MKTSPKHPQVSETKPNSTTPHVTEQVQILHAHCGTFADMLDALFKRLEPVLLTRTPSPNDNQESKESYLVPLAADLRSANGNLNQGLDRLRSIIDSIQI